MIRYLFQSLIVSISAIALVSCGGGGSNGAQVDAILAEQSVLSVGQSTVLRVEVSFDAGDVFYHGKEVLVVVRLPSELSFVEGSGEIDQPTGADHSVGAVITTCANGETFLQFNLSDRDLLTATNPLGDADAELKLTLTAVSPLSNGVIGARADENATFVCSTNFSDEAVTAIDIS